MTNTQFEIIKKHFKTTLSTLGKSYKIERDGKFHLTLKGIPGKTNNTLVIGFEPESDIKSGDILITVEGVRYIVKSTTIEYIKGNPLQLYVFLAGKYPQAHACEVR